MKSQIYQFVFFLLLSLFPLQMQAQSWQPQAVGLLPDNYGVYAISVVDENVVWAVAYDRSAGTPVPLDHKPIVLKTIDGGDNWINYEVVEAEGRKSFDIVAFDANTAMITAQPSGNGLSAGVFKTTNGGDTWTQIFNGYTGSVWIRFFNQQEGIIINRQNMATTVNGGDTWQGVPSSNIPPFQTDEYTLISTGTNSLQVVGDHIWFGTNMGRIYRSTDKGQTWSVSETSLGSNATIISEAFRNTYEGIALDISSSVTAYSKTIDGGANWTNVNASPGLRIRNITYVPGTDGTLIGITDLSNDPRTAYSTDFGETWKVIDESIPLGPTQFISPTVGWSGRSYSGPGLPAIYKWDGTDILSCNPVTESFPNNTLTHTGTGSSSYEVLFSVGSKTPSFTISGMQARINGNPNNRYIEEVTVTYVDGNGATVNYGTFSGETTSSVQVDILSYVQSVQVSLTDGYDGDYGGNLSVTLSGIDYCDDNAPCADDDGDGVCNVDDVCPGSDDNVDTDGDTMPDGCDVCPTDPNNLDDDGDGVCNVDDICPGLDDTVDEDNDGIPDCDDDCVGVTSLFNPDPLTHNGSGSATSTVFTNGNSDVSFTINGLNAKTNGNPGKRYIEEVTVTYDNGTNPAVPYGPGTFRGDIQGSVNVSISEAVQSVTISLTDIYDGDTGNEQMSVSMTDVSSCPPPPTSVLKPGQERTATFKVQDNQTIGQDRLMSNKVTKTHTSRDVILYPNPVGEELYIRFKKIPEEATITLFDLLGRQLGQFQIAGKEVLRIRLDDMQPASQSLLVNIRIPGEHPVIRQVILSR